MPAKVAHGGRVALAHLDQTGRRHPLECFADGGPGDPENLGEATFARQRLSGLHLAAEHAGHDLFEDVLGHRAPVHRLEGHVARMADQRPEVKWSYQLLATTSEVIASVTCGRAP